jgi:hypothetical protein
MEKSPSCEARVAQQVIVVMEAEKTKHINNITSLR